MTIRNLQIFLAVYDTGSTTAAAKKLLIAQPSVSVALAELENEYGVRLFERYAKRLYVTETGRELYPYARHLVDLFGETDSILRGSSGTGTLRVGSSITIGTCFLPGYLEKFQKKFPLVHVRVVVENTGTVEKLLLENKIDLGIVEGSVQDRFLIAEPYREDRLVAVCGPEHPFTAGKEVEPEKLAAERLILRERGSGVRMLADTVFRERGIEADPVWESVSTEAIIRAVEDGLGVSILPYQLVKDALKSGALVRIPVRGVTFRRQFSIVTHKNKFHTPPLGAFIAVCREDGDKTESGQ